MVEKKKRRNICITYCKLVLQQKIGTSFHRSYHLYAIRDEDYPAWMQALIDGFYYKFMNPMVLNPLLPTLDLAELVLHVWTHEQSRQSLL